MADVFCFFFAELEDRKQLLTERDKLSKQLEKTWKELEKTRKDLEKVKTEVGRFKEEEKAKKETRKKAFSKVAAVSKPKTLSVTEESLTEKVSDSE